MHTEKETLHATANGASSVNQDAIARMETVKSMAAMNRRLVAMIETSEDAIVSKNLDGIIETWNKGAQTLFGYSPAEAIGQSITMLIPADRIQEELMIIERLRRGERIHHYETIRRRKDGTLIDISLTVSPIKDEDGTIIGASKIARDISERKRTQEALLRAHTELEKRVEERTAELRINSQELQKRNEQLAQMASDLILTERRERRRLAGLLHDHLQQLLVASLYQLRFLSRRFKNEPKNPCDRIVGLLEESLKTSRTLTVELSPPILHEGGLLAGLQWLARDMAEKYGLDVKLELDENAETEREDLRVFLFEASRELLFNVVKHAAVKAARLNLKILPMGSLSLTIGDDGVGLDPSLFCRQDAGEPKGFGLLNIKERAVLLGGKFTVDSQPGKGAIFSIALPASAPWQGFEAEAEEEVFG